MTRSSLLRARHSSDASCGAATARKTRHWSGAPPAHRRLKSGNSQALSATKSLTIDVLLGRLVRAFGGVPGIRAIVLGGSRARGEATCAVGLRHRPVLRGRLRRSTSGGWPRPRCCCRARRRSSVTAIGEWGPWINGGAWLTVEGKRVDLLYRDLGKVRGVIEACHAGRVERVYQPGHPHAFVSAIYMGEVALCRVLWDPDNVLCRLKRQCEPYPPALGRGADPELLLGGRSLRWRTPPHGRGRDDPA